MDYLALLSAHLDFILKFYDITAGPLEERKRLIEEGKEPFVPNDESDDYPEYEAEWIEADNILRVLGQASLALLAKALQDYLRAFCNREGKKLEGKGDWLQKYAQVLEQLPEFTWNRSPVSYAQIEQINLTRNDFLHGGMIGNLRPKQDGEHFKKHPVSSFAEPRQVEYWRGSEAENDEPWDLCVTRGALLKHVELVRAFCSYVERQRTVF